MKFYIWDPRIHALKLNVNVEQCGPENEHILLPTEKVILIGIFTPVLNKDTNICGNDFFAFLIHTRQLFNTRWLAPNTHSN